MYATITQLRNILPDAVLRRLSDDDDSGSYDETILNDCLDSAAAEMNAYLARRITLPLIAPYPAILIKLELDIGIYNLYSRLKEEYPETRQKRYDNAMRLLKDFADGKAEIAGLVVRGLNYYNSRTQIYTEDFLSQF
jgi:phage gp36-like protein